MASDTQSVTEAARNGTTRDLLVAMRDRIAQAVDAAETSTRDLAALTKRLADVTKEIEAIDARAAEEGEASGGETPADDSGFKPDSA